MKRRFGIVTVNLNHGAYLAETIESVLCNLQPGDEYFVVDGGSLDASVDVIRKYERWLTGWCSEPDGGYAEALYKGFARVAGHYMCWINSGDLLLKEALDIAAKELASDETEMIFGDDLYIDEQGQIIFKSRGKVRALAQAMLFGGWTPLQDACFWKRSLYDRVGGIDPNLRHAADYDLFLRFALNGKCRYVPAAFSAFRRHCEQKSIAGSSAYAEERERCRGRELENRRIRGMRRFWLETYYRNALRIRLCSDKVRRMYGGLPAKNAAKFSAGAC